MRNIIVFENVTLDGFMTGPDGWIDWAIRDDEVIENSRCYAISAPTMQFELIKLTFTSSSPLLNL